MNQQKELGRPRILFITPEISSVPSLLGEGVQSIRAKAGGMADVSATLLEGLADDGADVHLAIPHYRDLFRNDHQKGSPPRENSRIHLAEDSAFYHKPSAYHGNAAQLLTASLAFQREVINHIIPKVQPDIVHCNDWMTSLIPAVCRQQGIKSLFTIHNIHRERTSLAEIENRGIDVRDFWHQLYFENYPYDFESSYYHNTIDLLSSAILNADFVTTVSPTFLQEMIHGKFGELPGSIQHDLSVKLEYGYAEGILNTPSSSYDPRKDESIAKCYDVDDHRESKRFNKMMLQRELDLPENPDAPMLFWPSRLDPIQKGCQLLTEILYETLDAHTEEGLHLVIIGDGSYQKHFQDIIERHDISHRVALRSFDERLSRQAFASADFVLLPSSFEPCGLPQMIGARYGTIPIVHNTGGLHDTVEPLRDGGESGNGFVFDYFTSHGLRWAIEQALTFYRQPFEERERIIARIMTDAQSDFGSRAMFPKYQAIFRKLERDLKAARERESLSK
ncbi:MAG: glycogen synthase [Roseibacillus sp.]